MVDVGRGILILAALIPMFMGGKMNRMKE